MATQQALLQQQVRELAVQVEALRALVKDTTTTAGHANRRAKIEQQAAERRRDGDRSERSEEGEQKKGDRPLAAENVFDKQFLEDA
jgi:alkylation response protein AidB-like acyl-CoA dehydrogenase